MSILWRKISSWHMTWVFVKHPFITQSTGFYKKRPLAWWGPVSCFVGQLVFDLWACLTHGMFASCKSWNPTAHKSQSANHKSQSTGQSVHSICPLHGAMWRLCLHRGLEFEIEKLQSLVIIPYQDGFSYSKDILRFISGLFGAGSMVGKYIRQVGGMSGR